MQNKATPAIENIIVSLNKGEVIAYPTEAVFGLGCDPDSEQAVNKLLELKQRPWEKGLILIADNYEQLKDYVDDSQLTDEQKQTMFASWPGPVTCYPSQIIHSEMVNWAFRYFGGKSNRSRVSKRALSRIR